MGSNGDLGAPTARDAAATPPPGHQWAEAEEAATGLVLLCECGWRTSPASSGEEAGRAWDAHLRSVRGSAG